ncbi:MAG: PASTA domain-containing protein [Ignavibacteriae bacterium]|nr:PASTA domain-containing protein [Ignavibacteriota bacterium]
MKKYLPYIYIFIGFAAGLIIIFWLVDSVIMPLIVHNTETVQVPNVVGKSFSDAETIINSKSLKIIKSGEQYSENVIPNTVINQIPKSGTEVKVGRTIYLIISKGRETLEVPYLIGKSLREARVNLIQSGLALGNVVYIASDSIGFDTVLSQSVGNDRKIPAGSNINLIVSKGSENFVKVPNLIGLSVSEAQSILTESGLIVGNIFTGKSETYMAGTVIDHSPAAGELVKQNSPVNLTIAK